MCNFGSLIYIIIARNRNSHRHISEMMSSDEGRHDSRKRSAVIGDVLNVVGSKLYFAIGYSSGELAKCSRQFNDSCR